MTKKELESMRAFNDIMDHVQNNMQLAKFLANMDEKLARNMAGVMLRLHQEYKGDLARDFPNIFRLKLLLLEYNEESYY